MDGLLDSTLAVAAVIFGTQPVGHASTSASAAATLLIQFLDQQSPG